MPPNYHLFDELGLLYYSGNGDGKPVVQEIGSPIAIVAKFRKPDGLYAGFAFPDESRCLQLLVVPVSDIYDGTVVAKLVNAGWVSGPRAVKQRICELYAEIADALPVIQVVARNGLQDCGSFLFDQIRIGKGGEKIVLDPASYVGLVQSGTFSEWREHVAGKCNREPFLQFAICSALAAPIKDVVIQQGALLNFIGPTTTGKTTALRVATSTYNCPAGGLQSWDISEAAFDQLLKAFNGLMLPMDEVRAGLDPKKYEHIMHRLGAQRTKLKAAGYGGGERTDILVLSTEEQPADGRRLGIARGGAAVRAFDIPIGNSMTGVFRSVSDAKQAAALAQDLDHSVASFHGTALPMFIEQLISTDWRRDYEQAHRFVMSSIVDESADQVEVRGARVFAAIGAAGVLAASLQIVPWSQASVVDACRVVFEHWATREELLAKKVAKNSSVEALVQKAQASELRSRLIDALGEVRSLEELRAERVSIDPNDPECPAFFYTTRDGVKAICVGSSRFRRIFRDHSAIYLRILKAAGLLLVNGSDVGFKLSVSIDGAAKQFVAIVANSQSA